MVASVISYVNSAVAALASVGTTITVNVPAGVVDVDFMLRTIGSRAPSLVLPSPTTGWTLWETNQVSGAAIGVTRWYRFASSEPANYALSGLTNGSWAESIVAFRGVDRANPKAATSVPTTSGTNFVAPGAITPLEAGACVIFSEDANLAIGSATPVWVSNNTTLVGQAQGSGAAVANPAVICGYLLNSGALTPNLSVSAGTFNAGLSLTSVLRPALIRPTLRQTFAVTRAANY